MISVINNSNDPLFNLALEEYILKQKPIASTILILWQSGPSVVIGRHQNPFEETDHKYIKENKIGLARRNSGGGAVYHDSGNLNFTCIVNVSDINRHDFLVFAGPVLRCLETIGLKAEVSGHNDITIDGQKFSGNAQYLYKDRILHHGTILFETDLSVLEKALTPKEEYASRSLKSVRCQVTNIREKLRADMDMGAFRHLLTRTFFSYHGAPFLEYRLTGEDVAAVLRLAESKYGTWEWTYGHSPEFHVTKEVTFAGKRLSIGLTVERGIITTCNIVPASLPRGTAERLCGLLTGHRFGDETLATLLADLGLPVTRPY